MVGFLMMAFIAAALFGCRKEEKAAGPEARENGAAEYGAPLPVRDVPRGWEQSGDVKVYVGKNLYDSIDGAADRFFQYSFRKQYVVGYSSSEPGKSISIEAYDMGTPDDAFGIFSCHDNIMSEHVEVGLAATISEMNLDFCQGTYFVRLLAIGFGEGEAEKPLRAFAEAIAGNIEPSPGFPELVGRLPEGTVEGSVLFFHTWETLNERRYIADDNVLNLDASTRGVVAAYTSEERGGEDETFKLEKDMLYLLEYPDDQAAQSAKMSYIRLFSERVNASRAEGKGPSEKLQFIDLTEPMEIYQLYQGEGEEQHLVTIMRVYRNAIFGIWEVTDAKKATDLAKSLLGNLKR